MQERIRRPAARKAETVDGTRREEADAVRFVQSAINTESSRPLELEAAMRRRMEARFGLDFGAVRLEESDLPGKFGADALAQGDLIRFAPGAFQPGTEAGERLLSHELGHVVLQSRGAPGGTPGLPLYDPAQESGADALAAQSSAGAPAAFTPAPAAQSPMQGNWVTGMLRRFFHKDRRPQTLPEGDRNAPWETSAYRLDDNVLDPYGDMGDVHSRIQNAGSVIEAQNAFVEANRLSDFRGGLVGGGVREANSLNVDEVKQNLMAMSNVMRVYPELRGELKGFDNTSRLDAFGEMRYLTGVQGMNSRFYSFYRDRLGMTKFNSWLNKMGGYLLGLVGYNNTSSALTGVHELGHLLENTLLKKFTEYQQADVGGRDYQSSNQRYIEDTQDAWQKSSRVSSEMIKKVLTDLQAGDDPKLAKEITKWAAKYGDGSGNISSVNLQKMTLYGNAANQKKAIQHNKRIKEALKGLHKMGLTSGYGANNPQEVFAEAIGDVFQSGDEANPLSRGLAKMSRELLDAKGEDFDRMAYDLFRQYSNAGNASKREEARRDNRGGAQTG